MVGSDEKCGLTNSLKLSETLGMHHYQGAQSTNHQEYVATGCVHQQVCVCVCVCVMSSSAHIPTHVQRAFKTAPDEHHCIIPTNSIHICMYKNHRGTYLQCVCTYNPLLDNYWTALSGLVKGGIFYSEYSSTSTTYVYASNWVCHNKCKCLDVFDGCQFIMSYYA